MIGKALQLAALIRQRASAAHRSPFRLARDIIAVARGPGRISPSEYFDYGLDRGDLELPQMLEFVGFRGQDVIDQLVTDDYSKILSLDKLTFDAVMRGRGFPIPTLLGVFDAGATRRVPGVPLASDAATLHELLRQLPDRPAYFKAAFGAYGRTNRWMQTYDASAREVVLKNGDRLGVGVLAEELGSGSLMGVLVQEALEPHPDIVAVCGQRLSGLRVQVLLRKRGPQVFRCTWKITTGSNVVDNFQHGGSGNLLGAVEIATGRVQRVIAGVGDRQVVNPRHPDTGAELVGRVIPDWSKVVELVTEASRTVPGFLVQGWDVALTPRGPVLMEVNWVGDVDLPQHAYGRGWLDEEFLAFLRERNLESLLDGPADENYRDPRTGRRGRRASHWSY